MRPFGLKRDGFRVRAVDTAGAGFEHRHVSGGFTQGVSRCSARVPEWFGIACPASVAVECCVRKIQPGFQVGC